MIKIKYEWKNEYRTSAISAHAGSYNYNTQRQLRKIHGFNDTILKFIFRAYRSYSGAVRLLALNLDNFFSEHISDILSPACDMIHDIHCLIVWWIHCALSRTINLSSPVNSTARLTFAPALSVATFRSLFCLLLFWSQKKHVSFLFSVFLARIWRFQMARWRSILFTQFCFRKLFY